MRNDHLERVNRIGRRGYWALILWIPLAIAAGMAFDHPRSGSHVLPWVFLLFVLALPVAVLTAPFFARHHLTWGRIKLAYAFVIVPQGLLVLPLMLSLLSMLYFAF